ncbi:MAG: family 20 glycosylhydrolase [Phycisphaerales bacterium JB040]
MSTPEPPRPPDQAAPLLIPRPRSVALDTARRHAPGGRPIVTRSPDLPPSGYRLSIDPARVVVLAGDGAGERAANATLHQLARQYGQALPTGTIEDAPALAGRGVMLDVSRCRVPTMAEFGRLIESFASLKLNHLQCYTEHAFAYTFAEPVWRGCDPITPDEARTLDRLCAQHAIELVPNQNCFGHLKRWLEHPEFARLAETHGDWTFLGMPRSGPFSLCPTDPDSLSFVERLLGELLPHFSSRQVNIGCDETHDVGQGRSAEAVRAHGRAEVYRRFVSKVCRHVLESGRTPMVWGDIAGEHPEVVGALPEGAVGLCWGYEPASDFRSMSAPWRDAGHPWWACPGTSSWRSFTGRSSERRANIRRAARQGVAGGAAGLLVTDWGDLGHHQVWPVALLAIAEAADAAWTGDERHETFLDAASLQVFGDESLAIGRWLEQLGDADAPIRAVAGVRTQPDTPARLANAGALFTELHPPPARFHLPVDPAPWLETLRRLESLASSIPTGAGELLERECRHALAQAMFGARVALHRRGADSGLSADALRDERDALIQEHRGLWLERSRPGGLDESCAFWEAVSP